MKYMQSCRVYATSH